MEGNTSLINAMCELALKQAELAEAVNDFLRARGDEGTVSDRTVRNWLTGKTRWSHPRQRDTLEGVLEAVTALAERLADTPTPAGPTPRKLGTSTDAFVPLTQLAGTMPTGGNLLPSPDRPTRQPGTSEGR